MSNSSSKQVFIKLLENVYFTKNYLLLNLFLYVEDPISVERITREIAAVKQRFTQSGGRRPFGISCLIAGVDPDGTPKLYQTDPSGTYLAWKANAIGRSSKIIREYLEQNYKEEDVQTEDQCMKMAIRALLEVVQASGKNLELAVLGVGKEIRNLDRDALDALVKAIEVEKQEEQEKKKKKVAQQ